MHIMQRPLFDFEKFIVLVKEEERLVIVLEGLDAEKLLAAKDREERPFHEGYVVGSYCRCSVSESQFSWSGAATKEE